MTVLLVIGLCACQTSSTANDPSQQAAQAAKAAVEGYLRAKVARDATIIRQLLCSDLEPQAETEITTFEGTSNARIEGMTCTRVGESNVVKCTGKIIADYGTEANTFPLGAYKVKQEDGQWKWCGEAPAS